MGTYAQGVSQTDISLTSWVKLKNPSYSQIEHRYKVFETCRHSAVDRPRRHTGPPHLFVKSPFSATATNETGY